MAWDIEKVGKNISKSFKENPWLWAGGIAGAGLLGYIALKGKEPAPVKPMYVPAEGAGGGGAGGGGEASEAGASGADLNYEGLTQAIEELGQGLSEQLYEQQGALAGYLQEQIGQLPYYTEPVPEVVTEVVPTKPVKTGEQQYMELLSGKIVSTPTFATSPEHVYNVPQLEAMATWSFVEQQAIGAGEAGTSFTPAGLGEAGLVMKYHPGGQVSFTPKGQEPLATIYTPASGSAGDIARATSPQALQTSREAVSKVTGKGGSIEQQLGGMTAQQKLSTLEASGLIPKSSSGGSSKTSTPTKPAPAKPEPKSYYGMTKSQYKAEVARKEKAGIKLTQPKKKV